MPPQNAVDARENKKPGRKTGLLFCVRSEAWNLSLLGEGGTRQIDNEHSSKSPKKGPPKKMSRQLPIFLALALHIGSVGCDLR
jgi:hypothetical protein